MSKTLIFAMHVREYPSTSKMSLRKKKRYRPVTVVGLHNPEDNTLCIGAAKCGKRDTFVKKEGLRIAKERAEKKPSTVINGIALEVVRAIFPYLSMSIATRICRDIPHIKKEVSEETKAIKENAEV